MVSNVQYPKVKTLFKLEPTLGRKKWGHSSEEILPESAPLFYYPIEELIFTEKIDGTNMGVEINKGEIVRVFRRNGGVCDPSNPSDDLYLEMADHLLPQFKVAASELALESVIFFGELCGPKIQRGGNYFDKRRFLCFDIYNLKEDIFFRWGAVEYFCEKLGIETVPVIKYPYDSLNFKDVRFYTKNLPSTFNKEVFAEGFIVRHKDDVCSQRRYLAKVRRADFV